MNFECWSVKSKNLILKHQAKVLICNLKSSNLLTLQSMSVVLYRLMVLKWFLSFSFYTKSFGKPWMCKMNWIFLRLKSSQLEVSFSKASINDFISLSQSTSKWCLAMWSVWSLEIWVICILTGLYVHTACWGPF